MKQYTVKHLSANGLDYAHVTQENLLDALIERISRGDIIIAVTLYK